jgi:hypothetical protein
MFLVNIGAATKNNKCLIVIYHGYFFFPDPGYIDFYSVAFYSTEKIFSRAFPGIVLKNKYLFGHCPFL